MKKIIFLLCVFIFFVTLYSLKESFELLPLEQEHPNAKNNLNIKLPTQVDRVKCEDESYKYCYNGDITKKDIFGNTITIEENDPYNYGKTYSDICYQKVYLEDYTQNLKGSSKTRDVFYDPYNICNLNYPWHLKLPIETTQTNECTSTKDIENYDKCIGYETPCKNKDIKLETNEIYTEYNCSDHSKVAKSLQSVDAKISIPGSSYNGNFNIIVIRSETKTEWINLSELQLWINNENILPANIQSSLENGFINNTNTEFINWNTKNVLTSYQNGTRGWKASNISNNSIGTLEVHSGNKSSSLYIPLANTFNIQNIQKIVLHNRKNCCKDRINGYKIEFYYVELDTPIYSIPINTTEDVYVWDNLTHPFSGTPQTETKAILEGTYEDTWRRGLDVYKGRTNTSGQIYDVKTCSKECSNYNYFALQNGENGKPQCFCGNSLTDATRYGPLKCDEKVGGAWCNSIYKNVCSYISNGITTTSDVCTISGENRDLIYDPNKVSELCKQQNCITESYPDMSQCYSDESVASYQHDVYYFDLKNTEKYPFGVVPSNPKGYIVNNNNLANKVKIKSPQIEYSVSACSMDKPLYANNECHSFSDNAVDLNCNETFPYLLNGLCVDSDSAINYVSNSCTKEKPYKYNNECYATIEVAENTEFILDSSNENGICFLKDITSGKVNDTGISCENLYGVSDLDISMLYNPITNNFVGQLEAGNYSSIDCSGTLTKCLSSFPYEKNSNDELVPIYEEVNEIQRDKIPEYPKPPPYKEPPISKYINPYNSDLHSNLFIQCKNDYNTTPQENMCPKELPICKGYVENEQFGFCNDTLDKTHSFNASNINHLSCKNDYSKIPKPDMCPYNLPYCEDNMCKESSLFYDRG